MGALDVYDENGNVVDTLPEDTDDEDELDGVLNPKPKEEGEGEGEPAGEPATPDKGGDAAGDTPGEEETAGEGEEGSTEGSEETPPGEEEETEEPVDDAQALRRLNKRMERQIAFLEARLQRLEKNVITDPEEGEGEGEPPSKIEQLQATINSIAQQKGDSLGLLVETMAQTEKYADIKEVCSQDNFSDLVSMAADKIAATEGREPVEVALELEADVWRRQNPYAYMYDLIKTYHPKYAKAAASKTKEAEPKPKPEEEGKEPPEKKKKTIDDAKNLKAPSTIENAGTGTKTSLSGWTAKRIDDLDEMDLDQVPAEVYDKYLRGELD
jgi:hypothetical protein